MGRLGAEREVKCGANTFMIMWVVPIVVEGQKARESGQEFLFIIIGAKVEGGRGEGLSLMVECFVKVAIVIPDGFVVDFWGFDKGMDLEEEPTNVEGPGRSHGLLDEVKMSCGGGDKEEGGEMLWGGGGGAMEPLKAKAHDFLEAVEVFQLGGEGGVGEVWDDVVV